MVHGIVIYCVRYEFQILFGNAYHQRIYCKQNQKIAGSIYYWFAHISVDIRVFHYVPLAAVAYCLNQYTQIPALPSYLISGVAAFVGGFIHEVLIRIPVLRWCTLGIKGKGKKHVQ